jgi:hypothetical protein
MSNNSKRPILVSLTSHWVRMLGPALVTTVGFSWLFVLPVQLRGHTNNPYIEIKLKSLPTVPTESPIQGFSPMQHCYIALKTCHSSTSPGTGIKVLFY